MIKSLLRTNLMLKFLSLLFGFSFWLIWGAGQATTMSVELPICFYNNSEQYQISAPEKLQVTLVGKRNDLLHINPTQLAIHIDAQSLAVGEQLIVPTAEQLFLPPTIKLLHWQANNPIITVREKIA